MPEITAPLRLPELRRDLETAQWLQGPPVTMGFARGAVVLVDFWEATCIHCLRTLPYLVEWHRRYADRGLVMVGVHTPEFDATKGRRAAERVVEEYGMAYPVLLDDDRETWQQFANHYWPAKYLADAKGYLRFEHVGEGAYGETERFLQKLLREAGDTDPMPEPLALADPVRPEDAPGAVCFRPTVEVHLGHHRGKLLSEEGWRPGEVVEHSGELREPLTPGAFAARGRFLHAAEHLEAREPGSHIELVCEAAGVYLVAEAPEGEEGRLEVAHGDRREDMSFGGVRMLELVTPEAFAWRHVKVRALEPGVRLFAVSFSGCGPSEP